MNKNYKINFGPQHPAAHGVLRVVLDMDGEYIQHADPHIGFLHRGTEKLIENKTYLQSLCYFDRLDYVAPMNQEHAYILAIEKLLNLEPPIRAKYIRVLFLELSRIMNHMLVIAAFGLDLGAMSPFLWLFEEREKILSFCERISGARLHTAFFRPGGINYDLDNKLFDDIFKYLKTIEKSILNVENVLTESPILNIRTKSIGVVSKKNAILWGFSGPVLRASNMLWDLRKNQSYEIYDELDFLIPVGENGDCFDRYMVRTEEIKQSISLCVQCLEKMPSGPFMIDNYKFAPPPKHLLDHSMEALIHHFQYYTKGFNVPEGEVYVSVEAPKGEFGVYLVSDGSNKPYRCKIRAPGFAFLQSLNELCKDHMLSDMVAILSSLDIVLGEVDR